MQVFGERILDAGKAFGTHESKDTQSEFLRRMLDYISAMGAEKVVQISSKTRSQIVEAPPSRPLMDPE